MVGQVFYHDKDYRKDQRVALLFLNGKILCRSKNINAPIVTIDPETLEEDPIEENFKDKMVHPDTPDYERKVLVGSFFTDGNYLYLVSIRNPKQ